MTRREGMQSQKSSSRILPRLRRCKSGNRPGFARVLALSWRPRMQRQRNDDKSRYRERQIAVAIGTPGGMHCFRGTLLRGAPRGRRGIPATFSASTTAEELIAVKQKGPFANPRLSLGLVGRFLSSWQAREGKQGYSLLRGIEQIILFGATEDALKQKNSGTHLLRNVFASMQHGGRSPAS